jgi:hypothetical protein
MSDFRYPEWQTAHHAAMIELDETKLIAKAKEAEAAIFHRLQALTAASNHTEERIALDDAIHELRVLPRHKLKFPDWA